MKNAYNQGLECDHGDDDGGDDGVSPKDVGHNIYILAHQVSHFMSNIILLILTVVFCAMACYIFMFWSLHFFSTCPLVLGQGEENALRMPSCVPGVMLGADLQENDTCHQKLLGQEGGNSPRSEPEK